MGDMEMKLLELFEKQIESGTRMVEEQAKTNSTLREIKEIVGNTAGEFKDGFKKEIVSDVAKAVTWRNASAVGIFGLIAFLIQHFA